MDLLLTVQNSAKIPFAEYLLRSVRCDVKGHQSASRSWVRRNPGARLQRPKVAMAPLRAWRSSVLAIVVWAGATSLVLISECGYLARQLDPGPIIQSCKFAPWFPEFPFQNSAWKIDCQPREMVDRNPLLDRASHTYAYEVYFLKFPQLRRPATPFLDGLLGQKTRQKSQLVHRVKSPRVDRMYVVRKQPRPQGLPPDSAWGMQPCIPAHGKSSRWRIDKIVCEATRVVTFPARI